MALWDPLLMIGTYFWSQSFQSSLQSRKVGWKRTAKAATWHGTRWSCGSFCSETHSANYTRWQSNCCGTTYSTKLVANIWQIRNANLYIASGKAPNMERINWIGRFLHQTSASHGQVEIWFSGRQVLVDSGAFSFFQHEQMNFAPERLLETKGFDSALVF